MIKRKRGESLVKQIEEETKKPVGNKNENVKLDKSRMIPSGSTLFNLALSESLAGAMCKGRMINIIGDSGSGKTTLAISFLAECSCIKAFDNYQLIHDDAEHAMEIDIENMFGSSLADRLLPPNLDRDNPVNSSTVQEFRAHIWKLLKGDQPFIYVLDSLDSLSAKEDIVKMEKNMKKEETGEKEKGSYGTAKAKEMSGLLGMLASRLSKTESSLIILSQTRDPINVMTFAEKTRSGGKALKFYSSHEIWLAVAKTIKKRLHDKEFAIGIRTKFKVTKNKLTGKIRFGEFPIYYDYGIDDITSCIEFIVSTGRWKDSDKTINAKDLSLKLPMKELIEKIENENLESSVRRTAKECWLEREDELFTARKKKYQ